MICVNTLKVSPSSLTLKEGDWYYDATVEICPTNATCSDVRWTSSNTNVATVNETTGYIHAVGKGTATIRAIAQDGSGKTDSIAVTVIEDVKITSIEMCEDEITIVAGNIYTLCTTIEPINATNPELTWSSDNPSVATADYNVVRGISAGTATIFARATDGSNKCACCRVTVLATLPVSGISILENTKYNSTHHYIELGKSRTFSAVISPNNAYNRNVIWSSSNPYVARVNQEGKVTAVSLGTVTITARTEDGGFTDSCTISIVNGIIVEKYPDENHSRIVFPNGKTWNIINIDFINLYQLNQNKPESQRFYDNTYETKIYDEVLDETLYFEPMKEYSDEELKTIYMLDPHGMAAYVREYAFNLPADENTGKTSLQRSLEYKDRIFTLLFNRAPVYYDRMLNGEWVVVSELGDDLTDYLSESEFLFGDHLICDEVTAYELWTVFYDLIAVALEVATLGGASGLKSIKAVFKLYTLHRSMTHSLLTNDFNGYIQAFLDGSIDTEEIEEDLVSADAQFKTENFSLDWASAMLELSNDLYALAETFNCGPHFYKEVLTQCSVDTTHDIYFRDAAGNLIAIDNIIDMMN